MQKLKPWLDLAANIGVIAGLVFLILEVRQNTAALRNEADVATWSISSEQAAMLVQDSAVASLMLRALTTDWNELTPTEVFQVGVFWGLIVDRLELQHKLAEQTGQPLEREDIVFPELLFSSERFRSWWEGEKSMYRGSFVVFFDGLLANAGR